MRIKPWHVAAAILVSISLGLLINFPNKSMDAEWTRLVTERTINHGKLIAHETVDKETSDLLIGLEKRLQEHQAAAAFHQTLPACPQEELHRAWEKNHDITAQAIETNFRLEYQLLELNAKIFAQMHRMDDLAVQDMRRYKASRRYPVSLSTVYLLLIKRYQLMQERYVTSLEGSEQARAQNLAEIIGQLKRMEADHQRMLHDHHVKGA
jgi:hypothetical protein